MSATMPRHANYAQSTAEIDQTDRTAREDLRDLDYENPFDDPDVRRRVAELIARSMSNQQKSGR